MTRGPSPRGRANKVSAPTWAPLPLAPEFVVGAEQPKLRQASNGVAVSYAPARAMPERVISKVSSDNGRPLHGAVDPADACGLRLRWHSGPNRKHIAFDGSRDVNPARYDAGPGRKVRTGEPPSHGKRRRRAPHEDWCQSIPARRSRPLQRPKRAGRIGSAHAEMTAIWAASA